MGRRLVWITVSIQSIQRDEMPSPQPRLVEPVHVWRGMCTDAAHVLSCLSLSGWPSRSSRLCMTLALALYSSLPARQHMDNILKHPLKMVQNVEDLQYIHLWFDVCLSEICQHCLSAGPNIGPWFEKIAVAL